MAEDQKNGWHEWGNHVLKELERLNECYENQRQATEAIRVDIAMLKVKAGVWGLLAGAIPATIALIYTLLKSK